MSDDRYKVWVVLLDFGVSEWFSEARGHTVRDMRPYGPFEDRAEANVFALRQQEGNTGRDGEPVRAWVLALEAPVDGKVAVA